MLLKIPQKTIFIALSIFLIFLLIFRNYYINKNISEFDNYVSNSDKILFDGDFLHPTYAYVENEKVIGIKSLSNPECGKYHTYYFINSQRVNKIILYKFREYSDDYCGNSYDSLFIINPYNNQVTYFTNFRFGTIFDSTRFEYSKKRINHKYIDEIKKWKSVNQ
ncbi:MAG: hypothetical protein H6604_04725 [Flavobacteriales bacterium]|nr:hypothetical protein [Flavobacteriales bacterium]